jgi:acyl-CoA synthetase (AMP-forming)/AMP-acid ligase II
MTNLASTLVDTARAHAGGVAVRVGEATTTYSELDEASAGVAGLLRERGLKPGDRVGIMLPNVAGYWPGPARAAVTTTRPMSSGTGSRCSPRRPATRIRHRRHRSPPVRTLGDPRHMRASAGPIR